MMLRRFYPQEHYGTLFNPGTGFFARIEEWGYPEPFWSSHGPELIDISITSWCDKACPTCYRSANENGRHVSLDDYRMVVRQAVSMDVWQVALGGGNPNQHPEFVRILTMTRQEYGVVPNYTTNGRGLTEPVLEASAKFCGAVAVSAYEPWGDFFEAVLKLKSFGIKTNIHFVLNAESVKTAIGWLLNPPASLLGVNAIVFLNYKPVGRGSENAPLLARSERYLEFLEIALKQDHSFRIGFDSCMVSGLAASAMIDRVSYDACEAARFTMYVSETLHAFPCSFMEATHEGIRLTKDNLRDIWQNSTLFRDLRDSLRQPACRECSRLELCMGGCPLFPDINLCPNHRTNTGKGYCSAVSVG